MCSETNKQVVIKAPWRPLHHVKSFLNPPTGHHQQTPSNLRDPPAETKVGFSSALFTLFMFIGWKQFGHFKYLSILLQGLDFMSSCIILSAFFSVHDPIRAQFWNIVHWLINQSYSGITVVWMTFKLKPLDGSSVTTEFLLLHHKLNSAVKTRFHCLYIISV